MRPRRTPETTAVFELQGGTRANDLPLRRGDEHGSPYLESVWELDDDERAAIAAGGTIELRVWSRQTPAVSLAVGASLVDRRELATAE